jgi:hypothetical protein
MWSYVFSPRLMAIDAAAGLAAALVYRIFTGEAPRTFKAWMMIALLGTVLRHTFPGTHHARSMPIGYVGNMTRFCMQNESRERCLCAVDALKAKVGEKDLIQLAVRVEVNGALPKDFLDALAGCSGYERGRVRSG